MLVMKDIKKIGDLVYFTGLPEGKKQGKFEMCLSIHNMEVVALSTTPSIYTQQARIRMKYLLDSSEPLPKKTVAYWC